MELRHLRYFIAVAETGSLTEAAEQRLYTSQPSLSRQIRDLESHVGVQLFSRSVRGVELTDAGKAFLEHARLALMHVDAAAETARRAAQPERKTFAIGFQTGHEMNWLPRAMQLLHDELQEIEVTVSSDYSPDLAEALARGRLDLAFLRVEPELRPRVPRRRSGAAHRPHAERPSPHRAIIREPTGSRRRDLHRRLEQGRRAACRHRGLSPPLRDRHQTRSRRRQHGDGHIPCRIHPRRGADARIRQEPAAAVGRQPTPGRRGTNDRHSRGLQHIEHLAGPRAVRVAARRTGAPEPEALTSRTSERFDA